MPFYDVISKKAEVRGKKLIEFILSENSGNQMKYTLRIAKIFPWKNITVLSEHIPECEWVED